MTPTYSLRLVLAAATVALVSACQRELQASDSVAIRADSARRDSTARARQDSINRAQPGYVIDSMHPVEEDIRRFKDKIGGSPVTALEHASTSRDALVRRIVQDVAKGDSADLALTAVTPREFIDLVYPSTPYTHAPYKESPAIIWMEIANPSSGGYKRLTRRNGGQAFQLDGYTCDPKPEQQGSNRLWTNCQLRVLTPTREIATHRWFGTIIERAGKFKVLSFKNEY